MLQAKHKRENGRISYSTIKTEKETLSTCTVERFRKKVLYCERILDTGKATLSKFYLMNAKGKNVLEGFYGVEQEWNNNVLGNSCIPLGTYPLFKRKSGKYYSSYNKRWNHPFVYQIEDEAVAPRSAILIHGVGNSEQLRGCIAPTRQVKIDSKGVLSTCGCGRSSYEEFFQILKNHGVSEIVISA